MNFLAGVFVLQGLNNLTALPCNKPVDPFVVGALGMRIPVLYTYKLQNTCNFLVSKRLFLLDDAVYHDVLEEDIAAYARFRFREMMDKATEVFDDGSGGWFETDPRDEQIQRYLLENGLIDNK